MKTFIPALLVILTFFHATAQAQNNCTPYPDYIPAYHALFAKVGDDITSQVHFLRSLQANYFGSAYEAEVAVIFCPAPDAVDSPLYWNKIIDQVTFLRELKTEKSSEYWDNLIDGVIDAYAIPSAMDALGTPHSMFNVDFFVTLIGQGTIHTQTGYRFQAAVQRYHAWATAPGALFEQQLRQYELLSKLSVIFNNPALNGQFEYLTRLIEQTLADVRATPSQ